MAKFAVVRIRGIIGVRKDVTETLKLLGLTRVNHCVVVDDNSAYRGMLQKAKDFITWGEIKQDALEALLRKRGRLAGDARLSDEYIKSKTSFASITELSNAIVEGQFGLTDVQGLKKVFRLLIGKTSVSLHIGTAQLIFT